MKTLLTISFGLFFGVAMGQSWYMSWQKSLGGSDDDYANSIRPTSDGGSIVVGYSSSNDVDVSGNHGGKDYWIAKLTSSGIISWQKSLGGSSDDYAYDVQQTTDGGYIVAGKSMSTDGDVVGNNGQYDAWVVKLNSTGSILWKKSIGGLNDDGAKSIQQTADGGYVLAGFTTLNGSYDYWVVKLNNLGNVVWQNSMGGSDYDGANCVNQTSDGGFIIAGYTLSSDGDVSGNFGGSDFWVLKLDINGNISWQSQLGGGSNFDYAHSIEQTSDGGYIIAGYTSSSDGDINSGNNGGTDYWIVKLNATGGISWERTYGGSDNEYAYSVQQTSDGGYIVAGSALSLDGYVSDNNGGSDYWILKLNSSGVVVWKKALGGSGYDIAKSIQETSGGDYIVAGYTLSNDGDITENNGGADYWIAKISFGCGNITGTDTRTECPGFVWIDGNTYNQNNHTATHTLQATNGCDSIVTLNLTVISPNISTDFWGVSPNPVQCGDTAEVYVGVNNNGQWIDPNDPDLDINISIGANINMGTATVAPYTINIYYTDGCGTIATDQITTQVMVDTDFQLQFTANPTSGTSVPLQVIFNNTTPNLNMYDFTWYFGDGTSEVNNSNFVQHFYNNNGLWDVSLVAQHPAGCTDTLFKDNFIFTTGGVNCAHNATINQTSPLSICEGDSILLTCNNDPAFTYQWNRFGANILDATNDSLYVTQSGSYSVTIFENNCPMVSSNVSVTLKSSPSSVISGVGSIIPCSGGNITMDAGSGYLSYNWSNGGSSQFQTITESGNYTVTVLGTNGCYGTSAPYVVNSSFLPIQEVCLVGVDSSTNFNRIIWEKEIIPGIDSFYVYRESSFANVYEKIGAVDYNDTALFIDQNSNPAIQAYRYKLSSLDTCGSETPLGDFHKTIHLTINQGVGQSWNLIWSHYEGIPFGSYNIYRGTSPGTMNFLTTISSNLNSYTDLNPPSGNGIYYQIEMLNPAPCNPLKINFNNSKSNIAYTSEAGIEQVFGSNDLKIFPNPTDSKINVIFEGDFNYTLLDSRGRVLVSGIAKDNETFDIALFQSGVYFLRINNLKGSTTHSIVRR
jgi:hypothetical protein